MLHLVEASCDNWKYTDRKQRESGEEISMPAWEDILQISAFPLRWLSKQQNTLSTSRTKSRSEVGKALTVRRRSEPYDIGNNRTGK